MGSKEWLFLKPARPMERFITEKLKPLVDRILDSKYKDIDSIKV